MTINTSAGLLADEECWRAGALSWVGRKVRITDGPSTENGLQEVGTVICVDATDYRPSAWVKIGERAEGKRPSYPSYRSCDLCWLEDVETGESGPAWAASPNEEEHAALDADVIAERISALRTSQSAAPASEAGEEGHG